MKLLNNQKLQIKIKQGLKANVNSHTTKALALVGELHYCTDTDELFIFNGTENVYLCGGGFNGTFVNGDGDTVTVENGLIKGVN
jgi:hypothetical protein